VFESISGRAKNYCKSLAYECDNDEANICGGTTMCDEVAGIQRGWPVEEVASAA
jgi:hypothetical protein